LCSNIPQKSLVDKIQKIKICFVKCPQNTLGKETALPSADPRPSAKADGCQL
jgi:hypothetical protein